MFSSLYQLLIQADSVFWSYVAFLIIVFLGCYLTLSTRFFQVRAFPSILKTFSKCLFTRSEEKRGVHPLKAFFASVGGMIGIGNVVGIVTAVQIGGPGALVWVWVAMLFGTVIKYSEIYLGIKHRVANNRQGFDGGPIYFLQHAFKNRWIPSLVALLLCIYGVEIYQFTVITDSVTSNWSINRYMVIPLLLGSILYAGIGGVSRIGKICGIVMPIFLLLYLSMGLWVIIQESGQIPQILSSVFTSAFTGHAAIGGFAGSTVFLAIQHGISRAAYSADIGIGYDSIIQSESSTVYPERQARLAILGICIDNVICTMSILIVLVTGVWKLDTPIPGSHLVQTALGNYFPYMHIFMPCFFFILGYTTVIAYFCVGIKCARFLHPKYGVPAYLAYGSIAWVFFTFFDQSVALLVMSLAGAMLLIINLLGIYRLRHHIEFSKE